MLFHSNSTTSRNLQKKIVLIILGVTLGIGLTFSLLCTTVYHTYMENSLIQSTDTNLKFLTDSVEHNLDSVFNLVKWSQSNIAIGKYIESMDDEDYAAVAMSAHNRLTEEYQNSAANSFIQRIVVGNFYNRFIQVVPTVYSSNINLSYEIPKLPYFRQLLLSKNFNLSTGYLKDPFYNNSENLILPVIRPIYAQYHSKKTGWVMLEISENLFCDSLEYYSCPNDASLYLILGSNTYQLTKNKIFPCNDLFSCITEETAKSSYVSNHSKVYRYTDPFTGKRSILVMRQLKQSDVYIAQTLSSIEMKSQYKMLFIIWCAIFALIFIVGLAITYMLQQLIAVRVDKIRNQLTKISSGDFSKESCIEWNDELGDIGRGINLLASNIEQLLENRIKNEKEKKDLEYKVLQNQINPHFLYNTLNSIKWMATIQGASGIADMTTSLSRLLRSISKGTKQRIPISEELSLIQDYFNIQKYRYGGTISLEIECTDTSLLDYSIIKFTLQPIVENAIFHGLEPKGNAGKIIISIITSDVNSEDLKLSIYDNGIGISQDKIESLLHSNENTSNEFFKEVGISNVHQRLQYEYGSSYGIKIDSIVGKYTCMQIIIPKKI